MNQFLEKKLGINFQSKVLFIYPHPDDETFSNAGLIRRLVNNKVDFKIICLTKGGSSTLAFGTTQEDLIKSRTGEFNTVMNFLGVKNFEILEFEDGNLENSGNLYDVIDSNIKSYKATHIVTYEPSGIYGHPDHIEVSKICTSIQKEIGYKLVYTTISKKYKSSKESLKLAKNPSLVKPIKPNLILNLTPNEFFSKIKALRLYKSQINIRQNIRRNLYHLFFLIKEYYYLKP